MAFMLIYMTVFKDVPSDFYGDMEVGVRQGTFVCVEDIYMSMLCLENSLKILRNRFIIH